MEPPARAIVSGGRVQAPLQGDGGPSSPSARLATRVGRAVLTLLGDAGRMAMLAGRAADQTLLGPFRGKPVRLRATLAQVQVQRTNGAPVEEADASDSELTKIQLRLESFRPGAGAGPELTNVEKDIRWRGLRGDARRYERVYEVQELAAAQQELRTLMKRSDLEKLP